MCFPQGCPTPRMWDNENICLMKTTPQAPPPSSPSPLHLSDWETQLDSDEWNAREFSARLQNLVLQNTIKIQWFKQKQWLQENTIGCLQRIDATLFLYQLFIARFKNVQPFAGLIGARNQNFMLSLLDVSISFTVNFQPVSQTILGQHYNKPPRALRWL